MQVAGFEIERCRKTDRKEYFGIIAKRIERKEELRDRGFTVFDLEDFFSFQYSSLNNALTPAWKVLHESPRLCIFFNLA